MNNITLLVNYITADAAKFIKELAEDGVLECIRKEEGCIMYEYFLPAESESCVLLVEKWQSAEAQKAHMKQPHMKRLMEIKDKYVTDTAVEVLKEA